MEMTKNNNYKVLFLDIDGVLNSEETRGVCSEEYVDRILQIIRLVDCKIVLSSSWRRYSLRGTVEFLKETDTEFGEAYNVKCLSPLIPHIIGVTKYLYADSSNYCFAEYPPYKLPRGCEIDEWLSGRDDVASYVIIDDDSDILLSQKDNFVYVDRWVGITEADVLKAIEILNK